MPQQGHPYRALVLGTGINAVPRCESRPGGRSYRVCGIHQQRGPRQPV